MTSITNPVPRGERPPHPSRHHSHAKLYIFIWAVLLVLTGLTVWTGNTDAINNALGGWALVLALVIASVKGLLVMLYFMHLAEASGTNKLVIGTAIGFVVLLIGMALADANTRWRFTNSPGSIYSDIPGHDVPRQSYTPQRDVYMDKGAPAQPAHH